MEQARQMDRYEQAQAGLDRSALSAELLGRVPEQCATCGDCNLYRMRLATRSALRGEMSSEEAISRFDDFVKDCPGTQDHAVCHAKNLPT